jgi:hypothetical protein
MVVAIQRWVAVQQGVWDIGVTAGDKWVLLAARQHSPTNTNVGGWQRSRSCDRRQCEWM